jgi:hypothetical protein
MCRTDRQNSLTDGHTDRKTDRRCPSLYPTFIFERCETIKYYMNIISNVSSMPLLKGRQQCQFAFILVFSLYRTCYPNVMAKTLFCGYTKSRGISPYCGTYKLKVVLFCLFNFHYII